MPIATLVELLIVPHDVHRRFATRSGWGDYHVVMWGWATRSSLSVTKRTTEKADRKPIEACDQKDKPRANNRTVEAVSAPVVIGVAKASSLDQLPSQQCRQDGCATRTADPHYAVRYGRNFQPFVDNRDVKHGRATSLPKSRR